MEYTHADRRYYGVTPTALAVGLAVVAILAAIVLATGHWPIALTSSASASCSCS